MGDTQLKKIFSNFSFTFIANIISFIVSVLITFIVPKFLGVNQYGYFQLYMFYTSYIGFLQFGWQDGIYLRYGGEHYDKLDYKCFGMQFRIFCVIETLIGMCLCLGGIFLCSSLDEGAVILLTGICILLYLPRAFLHGILQMTNRVKEYAIALMIEKSVYVCFVLIALLLGAHNYYILIIADLVGKFFAMCYILMCCKSIVIASVSLDMNIFPEIKENISVGIKLMAANIVSMLIVGIVRMAIKDQWDVSTFGIVSLTLSVSNLLMIFIRAVSIIMFPMLRQTKEDNLPRIYSTMRTILMIPLLGMLLGYYPIKVILSDWLPKYSEGLVYMALLFPMCVFESKMSMLVETYLKTFRKEKWLLIVNLSAAICSVIATCVTVYCFHSLDLAVVSIVLLLAFRCVFAELWLSTIMQIHVKADITLELLLTTLFIFVSWFVGGILGLGIYAIGYLCYLIIKRKEIISVLETMKIMEYLRKSTHS